MPENINNIQAEAEKPLNRVGNNKICLAMKTLTVEQMEKTSGGNWLNNHTWRQHLICIGFGALASAGGPLATTAAMALCYMSFD